MATAAYIAWLIVKITFFLVVLSNLGVLSMHVMDETSVIKDEVAEKIKAITKKYFAPLNKSFNCYVYPMLNFFTWCLVIRP